MARRAGRSLDGDRHGHGAAGHRRDRPRESAVGEDGGWIPRTRSRSSSSASTGAARASRETKRALRIGSQLLLGHPHAHAERDEPRLRAVVQVTLDPAQLGLLDVHRSGAARLEPLDSVLPAARRRRPHVRLRARARAEGRPDRPEVAARRDRPDGDEETDEHG